MPVNRIVEVEDREDLIMSWGGVNDIAGTALSGTLG